MKREFQVFIFLTFLTAGYYILNSIALGFLGARFMSIPFTILLPLSVMLERARPSWPSRATYIISMIWLVFLIYILTGYVVLFVLSFDGVIWVKMILVVSAALLVVYGVVNAMNLRVRVLEVPLGVSDRVRFVHLSDLHIGTVRSGGFLRRVARAVNELEPDAVLITGDLIDGSRPVDSSILSELDVNAPVFFVSGNHDTYAGDFRSIISDTGIRCIDQSVVEFRGVQIAGVGYSMARHSLPALLDALDFDPEEPLVLLHHLPVDWEYARERGVDLQLSGHTHGGQFYPFNLLVGLMFPHLSGLYRDSAGFLFVSEGTGTWGPPVRIGSSSEVAVLDIVPMD